MALSSDGQTADKHGRVVGLSSHGHIVDNQTCLLTALRRCRHAACALGARSQAQGTMVVCPGAPSQERCKVIARQTRPGKLSAPSCRGPVRRYPHIAATSVLCRFPGMPHNQRGVCLVWVKGCVTLPRGWPYPPCVRCTLTHRREGDGFHVHGCKGLQLSHVPGTRLRNATCSPRDSASKSPRHARISLGHPVQCAGRRRQARYRRSGAVLCHSQGSQPQPGARRSTLASTRGQRSGSHPSSFPTCRIRTKCLNVH